MSFPPQSSPDDGLKHSVRIKKEGRQILSSGLNSLAASGYWLDPGSITIDKWTVYLQGPLHSIWRHGVFPLRVTFPLGYPFKPPRLRFVRSAEHAIFHPNIHPQTGGICVAYGNKLARAEKMKRMLILARKCEYMPERVTDEI